ncbi:TonB family protein [Acidobacteriota bacterium]
MCPNDHETEIPPIDVTDSDLRRDQGQKETKKDPQPPNAIEAGQLSFKANPVPMVETAIPNRMRFTAMLAGAVIVVAVAIFVFLNRDAWFGGGDGSSDQIEPIAGNFGLPSGDMTPAPGTPSATTPAPVTRTPTPKPTTAAPTRVPTPAATSGSGGSNSGSASDLLPPVLPPDPIEELKEALAGKAKEVSDLKAKLTSQERKSKENSKRAQEEKEKRRASERSLDKLSREHNTLKKQSRQTEEELSGRISNLQANLDTTSSKLANSENRNEELESEKASLSEQISYLKREKRTLQGKTNLQDKHLKDDKNAALKLVARLQKSEQDLQNEKAAKRAADGTIDDLKKKLESTLKDLAREKERVFEGKLIPLGDPDLIRPERVKTSRPKYPGDARRAGIQGEVKLKILISETGEVIRTEIIKMPAGGDMLAEAAREAVRKWRYNPGVKKGVRVQVWDTVSFTFSP